MAEVDDVGLKRAAGRCGGEGGAGPAPSPRWQVRDARSLDWREWNGECVVRDAATAATHLLGGPGGAVLRCLLQACGPLDEGELLCRLAGDAAGAGKAVPGLPALRDVLRELEQAGLARREAP